MITDERNYFSVSQLNCFIQQVVQTGMPEAVWVCGEIQGYDRSRTKKHIFFDLCEKDIETHDVIAKIGLVIFSGRKSFLEGVLAESGNPFVLKDDIEVKFLCKVDFYPPHGAMRLIVESMDPAYTLGKIALEKQRLIALLQKNGTFAKNKQLLMPEIPLRIGLITSYDSAAYHDFLSELYASGLGFTVVYRNTLMQGKGAQEDICRAFEELYAHEKQLDVIVMTRGGGSIADLSCFDAQSIAEMIARSPVPVVTGIGHEIDVTIADLAAYLYQKTPTAVAKFFVVRIREALERLAVSAQHVFLMMDQFLDTERNQLRRLASGFQQETDCFLKEHEHRLVQIQQVMLREPLRFLEARDKECRMRQEQCFNAMKGFLKSEESKVEQSRRLIEASQPENICRRGFSITRTIEGKLVRSVKDVRRDQKITTQLADGFLESVVDRLIKGGS